MVRILHGDFRHRHVFILAPKRPGPAADSAEEVQAGGLDTDAVDFHSFGHGFGHPSATFEHHQVVSAGSAIGANNLERHIAPAHDAVFVESKGIVQPVGAVVNAAGAAAGEGV